jgi:phosphatidylglycerol:prolipoprotein diacylglycerol transferase
MTRAALYEGALCAAFWTALAGYRSRAGRDAARFVLALALGAALARAFGLLAVPAGLFVAGPWRAPLRHRFLDAALPALPLAFAVAKLGCLAAGCCAAAPAEALAFAGVQVGIALGPQRRAPALALAGIAMVRLAVLPARPGAGLSGLLALLWLSAAALRCRPPDGGERCPRPGSATSRPTAGSSRPGSLGSSRTRASSS